MSFNQNRLSLDPNHPAIVAGKRITLDAKIAGMTATKLTGTIAGARLPSGSILQAVGTKQGTGTGVSPNSNGTWLGTGFGKSITPSSTSSKILIMCGVTLYNGLSGNYYGANIYRHSAAFTANGAVSGTQLFNDALGFGVAYGNSGDRFEQVSTFFLDSPSTTSEIYYNVCHRRNGSSSGIFDGYNIDSTMVLLEVAG